MAKMHLVNVVVDDDDDAQMIVGNGAGDDVNDYCAVVVVEYLRMRKDVYQPFCYYWYYWLL